jgi:hypothetical protein
MGVFGQDLQDLQDYFLGEGGLEGNLVNLVNPVERIHLVFL